MNQSTQTLPIGTTLYNGKYQIKSVIEEGGLGITYKANSIQLGIYVAVKELYLSGKCNRKENNEVFVKSELASKRFEDYKKKFVAEGRSLAQFKHPNLIQVRDIVEENNTVYLIMDYVEDQTLETYVFERDGLAEEEALLYIRQIANALKQVHEKELLHKDIRPSNILITKEGKPVLVGMGMTGQFVQPTEDTGVQAPNYASMEQYIAQYTKKDDSGPYSDVYGIAATLYFCLIGEHPSSAINRQHEDLTPPKHINDSISDATNQAVLKGMAVKVENRYQTMEAFIAGITNKNNVQNQSALPSGTRLLDGKYRIDKVMGHGGFGITYQATMLSLNSRLVIKELFLPGYCARNEDNNVVLLSLSLDDYNSFRKDFAEEGRKLARINHPSIVKVQDVIEENNTVYLVTDYVEGQSLEERIDKKGPVSEIEGLVYTRQIAEGLIALHDEGILHKDIRPSNIIITRSKQAILVGLGINKEKFPNNNHSQAIGFAPLEQYSTEMRLGNYSDVYSLSATLYYALIGARPVSAFDRYYKNVAVLKDLNAEISEKTSHAVNRGISMKAAERYQEIEDFLADLEEVDPAILHKKRRLQWAMAASIVLLLATILYFVNREEPLPRITLDDYGKFMEVADGLIENGHYHKAVRYYNGILKVKPNDKEVLEAKSYAEHGESFNANWWKELDKEWQEVFQKRIGFQNEPSTQDLKAIFELQELYCYDTNIKTLDPLSNMINLQRLGCYNTPIKSLEPLKHLKELVVLDCSNTLINNLDPIVNLRKLKTIDFSNTQIKDLEPIESLTQLEELYAISTAVENIESLSKLQNLKKLQIPKTAISKLDPIAGLVNLQELYCYNTQISDLTPIANLEQLHTLHCYKTSINQLKPLENLTNLKELHCYNTPVNTLEALRNLQNLRVLYVQNTQINDISPLQSLTNLEYLKSYNTLVSDLKPLAKLMSLKELNCSKTQISDLTPLQSLTNLERLDISKSQVNSLNGLQKLMKLTNLQCNSTRINKLDPIRNLTNLQDLNCSNTAITNIEAVIGLVNLQKLATANTQITSFAPISNLRNLQTLKCEGTAVTDMDPIEKLVNLKNVDCLGKEAITDNLD
ncbi:MAG: protein kinase [Chitinophagales bacterium]